MSEYFETTIVLGAGVLTLFNLVDKIINASKKAKEPTDELSKRVEKIEQKMENEYEERFKRDLQRIDKIEEGNRITQKALLALLTHSIDGNNTAEMEKVRTELTEFLINK